MRGVLPSYILKMRICFIAHQATKEGAGRFLLDQADYLQARGVVVFVILPQNGILGEALAQRKIEYQVIPNPWWTKMPPVLNAPDFALTLAAARQMAAWFQRWKIDLVYTQTLVVPAGALGAALMGKPHVWHVHEFAYNPECIEMAIAKPGLARLLDLTSNLVIFNSKAVASEWEGCLKAAETNVVYNWISGTPAADAQMPVPVKTFLGSHDSFVMAIVGSVLPWKRQMDAVRSLENLVRQGFDVKLLIIGPIINGIYHDEIVTFLNQNKLTNRVYFSGYIENTASLLRLAKISLVCSRLEPFGRVTIESMSEEITVVGADSGGTSEIIEDGVNGLLFPVGNVDELTNQIRRLIQDEPLRKRLSINARVRADEFSSAEKFMAPLLEKLKQLIGKRNPTWPVMDIVGTAMMTSNYKNPATLTLRDHGQLLLGKVMRRLRLLGK